MLSSTSSRTVVSTPSPTTHTKSATRLATSRSKSPLLPPSQATRTSPRTAILKCKPPSLRAQSLLPSKPTSVRSNLTSLVSSLACAVPNSTTVCSLSVTTQDTGLSRTLGDQHGAWKVTSKWPVAAMRLASVVFSCSHRTQSPERHHQHHPPAHLHQHHHPQAHHHRVATTRTQRTAAPLTKKVFRSLESRVTSARQSALVSSSRSAQLTFQTVPPPSHSVSLRLRAPTSQLSAH
mmetsp:Transcript_118167/g.166100  ORF Transcript_118167/g.166100 Transcript_118167/m.166100 type:complete len:235 (+) Transcript_118167:564-1268(+)